MTLYRGGYCQKCRSGQVFASEVTGSSVCAVCGLPEGWSAENGRHFRLFRFQCSWVSLYFYGLPTPEWANISHVVSLRQTKRFATFAMESGTIVHLFRVTQHRGILWGWLR